jgi:hypothetical protein
MKRFFILLALCGCLSPRAKTARLLPSSLSLRAQGELAAERSDAVGAPNARSGHQDEAAWSALLVAVWRDQPDGSAPFVPALLGTQGWSLDPNGSADPAGSGLSWTTYSIEPGAQP